MNNRWYKIVVRASFRPKTKPERSPITESLEVWTEGGLADWQWRCRMRSDIRGHWKDIRCIFSVDTLLGEELKKLTAVSSS